MFKRKQIINFSSYDKAIRHAKKKGCFLVLNNDLSLTWYRDTTIIQRDIMDNSIGSKNYIFIATHGLMEEYLRSNYGH